MPPLPPCHPPSAPFCPFTGSVCFWPLRFCEDQKQPKPAEGEQKMKLEDIKSKTKDAVDYLVQSLESGHSEVLTQYLGAMARFHTYSFGNVMLIARQRAVTYCYTSLESMNIGGCASLETRYGRHVAVRTNLLDLVDGKQITRD
jgi:hypothetical protein